MTGAIIPFPGTVRRGLVWVLPDNTHGGSWGVHHTSEHYDHGAFYGSYLSFDDAQAAAAEIANRLGAEVVA